MDDLNLRSNVRKLRVLTLALIVSGVLNIGLVAALFSGVSQGNSSFSVGLKMQKEKAFDPTIEKFFTQIAKLSFHELVSYLTNRDLVGEGFLKRDIAVSALVLSHHFNLDKALGATPLQRRVISLGSYPKVEVFPGLGEEEFDAIIKFAYEEKWPLTAEGIFKLLKKMRGSYEPTLVQAFFVTPEFHALQVLFQKTESSQDPMSLLKLVSEGTWETLHQFAHEQQLCLDLSVEKRRVLLFRYLSQKSKMAAQLLLSTDFVFVAKRLDDAMLAEVLSLLDEKTLDSERLCLELLHSPRTDAIWLQSAGLLYSYAGEIAPQPLDVQTVKSRFLPTASSLVEVLPRIGTVDLQYRSHVVKDGDTLWKIARQYNVRIDEIAKLNNLEKDRLRPGMTLKIPAL